MDSTLKARLVEALQYPRSLMKQKAVPGDGSEESGRDWIFSVKEIPEIKNAPLNTLVSALGMALKSVQEQLNESEHDLFCACEACAWQRRAGTLYSEARCHPELGPPPIPH